ncbi:MAG: tetratricopeptide repeat protein [Balneolales bacterium]|nr:tetratricopeptide repeat protein [Balneolales bacterium]
MRKIVPVLLILFFLAGCRSSFKSNFRDFSAYYNTFYNAKKSYNLGEEKSLNQPRNYNTLQPIRVYETPLGAGGSDFQNAIDKGASILRKFDDTKWVDDALEIIGKSYYYRMEYFSADQKFDEQYITSTSDAMKQRAVFWKGRVLYEFQAHSQAIQYLTEQLAVFDGNWSGDLEFQVKTILAEHYIAEENWVIALDLLNEGIPGIPGRANKERGYFLIGQINEILGDPKAAFDAYDNVEKHYNVYELQFEAKKKKAEVARALGNSDEAFRVFSSMVRDDKNTEFVAELNFELGKTEQDRSNFDKAEQIYQSILRDPFYKPSNITKAQVYNGLAEIYRFNNKDFTLAAAYYDSSARMNVPPDQLPDSYNAKELADSFGQYASIKNQIHEKDSLLWLGMLSPDEFDSVLTEIENRMVQEMERLRKEQEEQRNTLVNVNQSQNANNQIGTGTNGFLNVENPVLIAQAREQFNAIWQGRPLVDNWRVNELILNTIQSDSTFAQEQSVNGANPAAQTLVNIDLSRIPFTASEQDSMRHEKSFLYYEIGNLFFLSLNLPDSAEFYFNKLLEEQPYSEVAPVTLYSLTELYTIQGENVLAQARAQELVKTFPNSIYADRLMDKFELERPDVETEEGTDPITTFLALSSDNSLGYLERAQALSQFSISEPQNSVSDRALYESIQNYIRVAKSQPNFEDTLSTWQQMKKNWEDSL